MKNTFYAFAFTLSALTLTTACTQEESAVEQQETSQTFTLIATYPDADTRTWVEGTNVYWNEDDVIQLYEFLGSYGYSDFGGTGTLKFDSYVGGDKKVAKFTGKINIGYADNITIWPVYPADKFSLTDDDAPNLVYSNPNAQYTYNYSSTNQYMRSNSPMEACIGPVEEGESGSQSEEGVSATFTHLYAMLRIKLTNVPAKQEGTLYVKHTVSGSTVTDATVTFSNTENSAATLTFDIPIPDGKTSPNTYTASVEVTGKDPVEIGSKTTTTDSPTKGQIIALSKDWVGMFYTNYTLSGSTTVLN